MIDIATWYVLVLALPTENATARMRFWRALKAAGCAVLRDGVYLLPATPPHETTLRELAEAIIAAGGSAQLLDVRCRDPQQSEAFRAGFDRSEDYAALSRSLNDARKSLAGLAMPEVKIPEINRLRRRLYREFEAIRANDFFPNAASAQAQADWQAFADSVATVLSPDEPQSIGAAIPTLARALFQGRTWATRRRLWVDRVASAWLIQGFIDQRPRFLWLKTPAECPADALGFDFDGARFSHIGTRVTFEVLLASFALDNDPGLTRLGALVHALDIGTTADALPAEAAGFEAILSGLRQQLDDDDALLAAMTPVLNSLYVHFSSTASAEVTS